MSGPGHGLTISNCFRVKVDKDSVVHHDSAFPWPKLSTDREFCVHSTRKDMRMVLMTMEDKLEIFGLDTIQVLKFGTLVLIVLHHCRHGVYLWVRFTSSPKTLNTTLTMRQKLANLTKRGPVKMHRPIYLAPTSDQRIFLWRSLETAFNKSPK